MEPERPSPLELEVKRRIYGIFRSHDFDCEIERAFSGVTNGGQINPGKSLAQGLTKLACELSEKYNSKEVNATMKKYTDIYFSR